MITEDVVISTTSVSQENFAHCWLVSYENQIKIHKSISDWFFIAKDLFLMHNAWFSKIFRCFHGVDSISCQQC